MTTESASGSAGENGGGGRKPRPEAKVQLYRPGITRLSKNEENELKEKNKKNKKKKENTRNKREPKEQQQQQQQAKKTEKSETKSNFRAYKENVEKINAAPPPSTAATAPRGNGRRGRGARGGSRGASGASRGGGGASFEAQNNRSRIPSHQSETDSIVSQSRSSSRKQQRGRGGGSGRSRGSGTRGGRGDGRNNNEQRNEKQEKKEPNNNYEKNSSKEEKTTAPSAPNDDGGDWADLMAEEEEERVVEPISSRGSNKRKDSWASQMNNFEETQQQPKKAISVIRIKPSEMSRVRKESEKYADNGDDERHTQQREVIHRSNQGYRSARGGGGGRQRKTSYDPDYDRSVTFRSRHDSENERKIMLMSGDQGGSGVGAGARHRGHDNLSQLKHRMSQLVHEYRRSTSPPPPDYRQRQDCLSLFREMTLNEPEVIFSSKIDVNSNEKVEGAFWSGVFYKEVELYRKLLNNCPETDSSSTTAKYEQFLHEAIGFYEQLIQSLEKFYDFNFRYYATEGARHAQNRRVKICLYLCQQFYLHMGDLARYIDQTRASKGDRASQMGKTRSGKFARDYYQTAKDLDPRHGKPHFNLGILASEQQRHFEAIIHFIRAASVDKAGGSAVSTNLNREFEMARREAVSFLNHRDQRVELRKMKENQAWVVNFVQRNLKPDQTNKRFKLTWLAALGRIFTNIDTDQLERFQVQAINDFEQLIQMKRSDERSILPASILVEIAVSSLFAIHCTEMEALQSGRTAAIQLYFGVMSVIIRRLTAVLSNTLKTRPKGNAIIVGDSTIRLLPMDQTKIELHPCPGKNVIGIRNYIRNMPKSPTTPLCILHCGAQDVTSRERRTTQEIVADLGELIGQTQEKFPNATIVYSAILPREGDNEQIREVNKAMLANNEIEHLSAYRVFDGARQFYKQANNRNNEQHNSLHMSEQGKRALATEFEKFIGKQMERQNPLQKALEMQHVTQLLPALRILMEFFSCAEYHHLWSPLPETLLNNLDPSVALADLANLLLDPALNLPCKVSREKMGQSDVHVNCLESDDLQGFRPLAKSKIGHTWYTDSSQSRSIVEDCVRLRVIIDALEFQLNETEHRLISFKNKKYLPISNHVTQRKSSNQFVIKHVVPDTNCWIERFNDIEKLTTLSKSRYQLEVLMSIVVANELDGLRASKKEKTVRAAEDALAYVKSSGMRLLAVNGKILAGGKSYALQTEDKKKNDELIMESAKKLHGGLLLTDDKNLLIQAKISSTPHETLKVFRQWIEKG